MPGAVALYWFLLDTNWDAQIATGIVAGWLGLLSYAVYRQLMDELPVPVGG